MNLKYSTIPKIQFKYNSSHSHNFSFALGTLSGLIGIGNIGSFAAPLVTSKLLVDLVRNTCCCRCNCCFSLFVDLCCFFLLLWLLLFFIIVSLSCCYLLKTAVNNGRPTLSIFRKTVGARPFSLVAPSIFCWGFSTSSSSVQT